MENAYRLLQKAEKEDQYQFLCQTSPINSRARSECSYTPWMDQRLAEKLIEESIVTDCSIVIMNPTADGGMPHTRGKKECVVCIPAYYSQNKLLETLEHELIHIDQKRFPETWKYKLQEKGWTFLEAGRTEIPEEWLRRCRINPDTFTSNFPVWKERYIPLPVFEREDKPRLREISIRWWDRQTGRLEPSLPSSFAKVYGTNLSPAEMEHPFELYAYKGFV